MISYQVTSFGEPLQKTQVDTPAPQGGEVLLKVLAAGVCHTDIHTWHGSYDLGGGKRLSMQDRGVTLPLTLGHEIVGEVIACGPDAGPVAVGQTYVVYPWIGCGTCKVCLRDRENLCPAPRFLGVFQAGGYSDHVIVPAAKYLVEIGELTPAQAAPYACSGLTTYSAIKKIDPQVLKEEPVVVIGAGGVGLMCITLLRALGAPSIVVVETNGARRGAALAAGATHAIDGAAADALAQVNQAVGGGAWAVIDCVGAAATVEQGIAMLVKGGQLIVIGLFGGETTLSVALLPMRAATVQGSYIGNLPELRELMALVRQKRPQAIPLICRCLDEAPQSLHDLEAGQIVGRVILQPNPIPESA